MKNTSRIVTHKIADGIHAKVREGLTAKEAQKRLTEHGYNEIVEKPRSLTKLFLKQFQNAMVLILVAAVLVSISAPLLRVGHVGRDEMINSIAILSILLINALLGFFQEWRAENAIAALKALSAPKAKVRRDGEIVIIPSREVVAGDIMLIETGDRISADGHIVECNSLQVDESSLTGESEAVSKSASHEDEMNDSSMVFSGTTVTMGNALLEVTATGNRTQMGAVSAMVQSTVTPETPLQRSLKQLGNRLGISILGICAIIFFVGFLQGREPVEMFLIAVSLAVAAVPEGLPAIVTICLAIGVQRMYAKHALIRRLDAIETVGSVTVICTDKTGTITQNMMTVTDLWCSDESKRDVLLTSMASCNRAEPPNIGDATERALLGYAEKGGVKRLPIEVEEVPFSSEKKYMITVHEKGSVRIMKGAPEVVTGFCIDRHTEDLLSHAQTMATHGLRAIAFAENRGEGWQSLGLAGLLDPPKDGVKEALAEAKQAGIRTIMITGDNPVTAGAIGEMVGLTAKQVMSGKELDDISDTTLDMTVKSSSIFARVRPQHKVRILQSLLRNGEVVAMCGDGVNDAPALKQAHVGIAMGKRGTDTARESAAIVLTDDNYTTIVRAIAEGRRLYDNIRKFVVFLLRTNMGEVFIISMSILMSFPVPLLPIHILWINLATDSLPALALAAEKGSQHVMRRRPRSLSENILHGELLLTLLAGALNMIIVLALFHLVMRTTHDNIALARTVAMTTTILFQCFLSVSSRSQQSVLLRSPLENLWLLGAIAISLFMHLTILYTPLSTALSVAPISGNLWIKIVALCFAGFVLFEAIKLVRVWRKE